jgi:hypothetical protein
MMTDTKTLTREVRIWTRINALKRLAANTVSEYEACDSNLPEEYRRRRAMLFRIAGGRLD